jgi:hypothetical protein
MTYYYNGTSWGDYLNYREHPIFATTGGESIPRLIVQVLLRGLLL